MVHRIDGASAAVTIPAAGAVDGTPGYFSEGNPGTGTPATIVSQAWMNMTQEELVAVVLAAGITPAKGSNAQVLAAIRALCGTALQVVTATTTLTVPAGKTGARVRGWGAGGGGGGSFGSGSGASSAAGGSFFDGMFTVTPGASIIATIGAPGSGGVNSATPTAGTSGTTTSFGAFASAPGGPAGFAALSSIVASGPGPASNASGGALNVQGDGGGLAYLASGSVMVGSRGAASPFGGNETPTAASVTSTNGATGRYPGGGGAGGFLGGAGGAGAAGLIIVEWLA